MSRGCPDSVLDVSRTSVAEASGHECCAGVSAMPRRAGHPWNGSIVSPYGRRRDAYVNQTGPTKGISMRRHISKRTTIATLLTTGTLVAGAMAAASAVGAAPHHAGATAGTTESFLLSYGPHETEVVVAHGAFTGGGKDLAADNSDTLYLGGGTLRINHPDSKSHFHEKLNPKTCFAALTITGPYTLDHGTGKYADYTGSGTYTVNADAIAKRKPNGKCNQNADPTVEAAYIRASGPVSKK
jgi:hypothetical protein